MPQKSYFEVNPSVRGDSVLRRILKLAELIRFAYNLIGTKPSSHEHIVAMRRAFTRP